MRASHSTNVPRVDASYQVDATFNNSRIASIVSAAFCRRIVSASQSAHISRRTLRLSPRVAAFVRRWHCVHCTTEGYTGDTVATILNVCAVLSEHERHRGGGDRCGSAARGVIASDEDLVARRDCGQRRISVRDRG